MYSLKHLQVSLLESSQKEIIERMVDFIQFWSIQKTQLVQHAPRLTSNFETRTKETIVCTLSNGSGPTTF